MTIHREWAIHMATEQQAREAAAKQPKYRSRAEQDLVDQGRGSQAVRNLDHDAQRRQNAGLR